MSTTLAHARALDGADPLASFRNDFHFPKDKQGKPLIYFCGNSLGLQPKRTREFIENELEDWATFGVEGHFGARKPWLPYHELLTEPMARVVGAKPIEVVVMNQLTVNLHLMMASFYRPTKERCKILVEAGAFPSDQYAVASQIRFHGYDPVDAIIEVRPREGEYILREEDLHAAIARDGHQIALILLGSVNYLTGQSFDVAAITRAGHAQGCRVGFDFAHGAGNLPLQLHDWGPDFAVWCSYKYLNSGPGGAAGAFVHERHSRSKELPRLSGWWGHNKSTRFQMGPDFDPIPGAEGWQLSNPPIFQLAALGASLELFDRAGMTALRNKSEKLTGFLESCLQAIPEELCRVITPRSPGSRGCQLSLKVKGSGKELQRRLAEGGAVCDFREPDIVRLAPTPLYNSFEDCHRIAEILKGFAHAG